MKSLGSIASLFVLITSTSALYAAETDVRDVSVAVPKTEIQLEPGSQIEKRRALFSLMAAYWNPSSIQFASRSSATASSFDPASLPRLSGEVEFAGKWYRPYLGAQFYTTTRRGAIQNGPTLVNADQRLFLGSLTGGIKVLPPQIQTSVVHPFIAAAIHPTAMMVNSTILSDDATALGMFYEISGGLSAPIRWLPKEPELSLGIDYTFGKIRDSKLNGLGLEAGLKFSI